MPIRFFALFVFCGWAAAHGRKPLAHNWENVGSMLHGWLGDGNDATQAQLEFYAKTYQVIILNGGTPQPTVTDPHEIWHFVTARKLKALNPNVTLFLYENIVFGPINFPSKWSFQSNPALWLRDDNNQTVMVQKPGQAPEPWGIDWRSPAVHDWFASFAFVCGFPSIFDGVMVDGADSSIDGSFPAMDPTGKIKYDFSLQSLTSRVGAKLQMINFTDSSFPNAHGVIGNPLFEYGEITNTIVSPLRIAAHAASIRQPPLSSVGLSGNPFPINHHWEFLNGLLDEMYGGFSTLTNTTGPDWDRDKMAASIEGMQNASNQVGGVGVGVAHSCHENACQSTSFCRVDQCWCAATPVHALSH
jgi:hypothetical protein